MAKLISRTYSEALFAQAVSDEKVEELFEEAKFLKALFAENKELLKLLSHPNIELSEKLAVVENIFAGRADDDMTGFLRVIVQKGRSSHVEAILDDFIDRVKAYKKIGVVRVTAAKELTEGQKESVQKKISETTQFSELEMHYQVDESLIGGVVIRIGDRVVDGSVKNRLYQMKKELSKIQLS